MGEFAVPRRRACLARATARGNNSRQDGGTRQHSKCEDIACTVAGKEPPGVARKEQTTAQSRAAGRAPGGSPVIGPGAETKPADAGSAVVRASVAAPRWDTPDLEQASGEPPPILVFFFKQKTAYEIHS